MIATAGTLAAPDERARSPLLAFSGLVAFAGVLLLSPQSTFPALGALHPALLAGGAAIFAVAGSRILNRRALLGFRPGSLLPAALLAWAAFTIPFSMWPGGSAALLSGLLLKSVIIFWLVPMVVDSQARLVRFFAWLAAFTVPIAVTALLHLARGQWTDAGSASEMRIEGYDAPLTANPNDLALTLNMIIPLVLALRATTRSRALRTALACLVALDAAAVLITFSRAGFMTLVLIAAIEGRRALGSGRLMMIAGVAVVMVLLAAPGSWRDRMATIGDANSDPTGSSQERWRDYGAAVRVIAQQPISGAGLGMNMLALNEERGPQWHEVHDAYLQSAADLGLPGLALFLGVIGVCFLAASEAARSMLPGLSVLGQGLIVSLFAFAFAAIFQPAAWHFWLWLVGGLSFAAREIGERDR